MIVVDASVAIKWFLPEPGSIQALQLLENEDVLIAPSLIHYEVANIAWKRVRRGDLTREQADAIQERLPRMLAGLLGPPALIGMALEMAHDTGASVYDASYLALAVVLGATFVTADERLWRRVAGQPWADLVRLIR